MTSVHAGRLTSPVWAALRQPDEVAGALTGLYARLGHLRYGESVTQAEHACQAGAFALAAGGTPAQVVAALLHDVGHLLLDPDGSGAGVGTGDPAHEIVGADFLARWFGDEVTLPVRLHVAAKRYLCATDPAYAAALSPASARSLEVQGGAMTADEVGRFAAEPGSVGAVALRRWDDRAKVAGAPVPSLDFYRALIHELLTGDQTPG